MIYQDAMLKQLSEGFPGSDANNLEAPNTALPESQDVSAFAQGLGMNPEDVAFMQEVPEELRAQIIRDFDPRGTKDGNVLGRLTAYVKFIMRRNGCQPPASLNGMDTQHKEQGTPRAEWHGGYRVGEHVGAPAPAQHELMVSAGTGADPLGLGLFVERLRLEQPVADFLGRLPEDLQTCIVRGFNPSGTKDGNIWGRLFGYVRSLWSRRLNLSEAALAYVRGLPEDLQQKVITEFDAAGSKDGNVSARLIQFARGMASRAGHVEDGSSQMELPGGHQQEHVQQQHHPGPQSGQIVSFAQQLALEPNVVLFLQALPAEIQAIVVRSFDPSGTNDGNVWARLFAFVRRIWSQHWGWDKGTFDYFRSLPEDQQIRSIINGEQFVTAQAAVPQMSLLGMNTAVPQLQLGLNSPDDGTAGRIALFVQQWGLDGSAAPFLQSLPGPVRDHVLSGFNTSGTKDGNAWGRLLGFARCAWAKYLGLDQEAVGLIKGLPEDAQMVCLAEFDPSGTKDGNLVGRLQGFVKKAMAQCGHNRRALGAAAPHQGYAAGDAAGSFYEPPQQQQWQQPQAPWHQQQQWQPQQQAAAPGGASLTGFIERCGLDPSTLPYLESLSPDILSQIISDFDPSGTKDGNVLGRLQGYVRLLTARQRRGGPEGHIGAQPQIKRPRFM